jgi:hypothetical protein
MAGTTESTGEAFGFYDRIEHPEEEAPQTQEPDEFDLDRPREVPEEEPTEEEQKLLAGKFQTPEAMEQAYQSLEREFTKRAQETAEIRSRQEQQDELFQALVPMLMQQQIQENPELAEQLDFAERVGPLIDQRLEPVQTEMAQAKEQESFLRTVADFRTRHPDVPPNSQQDYTLATVLQELDLVKEDPEALEVAYEATMDPKLRFVLNASPHLSENDAGMQMARLQASQLQLPGQPAPALQNGQAQGGTAQQVPQRQMAFVEKGPSGAPTQGAPGETGGMPEVVALWRRERESPMFR